MKAAVLWLRSLDLPCRPTGAWGIRQGKRESTAGSAEAHQYRDKVPPTIDEEHCERKGDTYRKQGPGKNERRADRRQGDQRERHEGWRNTPAVPLHSRFSAQGPSCMQRSAAPFPPRMERIRHAGKGSTSVFRHCHSPVDAPQKRGNGYSIGCLQQGGVGDDLPKTALSQGRMETPDSITCLRVASKPECHPLRAVAELSTHVMRLVTSKGMNGMAAVMGGHSARKGRTPARPSVLHPAGTEPHPDGLVIASGASFMLPCRLGGDSVFGGGTSGIDDNERVEHALQPRDSFIVAYTLHTATPCF